MQVSSSASKITFFLAKCKTFWFSTPKTENGRVMERQNIFQNKSSILFFELESSAFNWNTIITTRIQNINKISSLKITRQNYNWICTTRNSTKIYILDLNRFNRKQFHTYLCTSDMLQFGNFSYFKTKKDLNPVRWDHVISIGLNWNSVVGDFYRELKRRNWIDWFYPDIFVKFIFCLLIEEQFWILEWNVSHKNVITLVRCWKMSKHRWSFSTILSMFGHVSFFWLIVLKQNHFLDIGMSLDISMRE